LNRCQGGNSKVLWEKRRGYHSDDVRNSCSEFQSVTGYWVLGIGFWMLDAGWSEAEIPRQRGCWILDAGFWIWLIGMMGLLDG